MKVAAALSSGLYPLRHCSSKAADSISPITPGIAAAEILPQAADSKKERFQPQRIQAGFASDSTSSLKAAVRLIQSHPKQKSRPNVPIDILESLPAAAGFCLFRSTTICPRLDVDFLLTTGAAGLAAPLAAQVRAKSPNDRIQIALIGAGGMGTEDATSSLAQDGVRSWPHPTSMRAGLTRAKERWGNQVFTTRDYREVLARPDIDAVIIATPDHWHAQIAIDAMNAGKDVYVEKPMVQKIEDGRRVIEAQKKTGRILQVGSQRVSSIVYQKAKDLLRAARSVRSI